jgi:hypothetical protein
MGNADGHAERAIRAALASILEHAEDEQLQSATAIPDLRDRFRSFVEPHWSANRRTWCLKKQVCGFRNPPTSTKRSSLPQWMF